MRIFEKVVFLFVTTLMFCVAAIALFGTFAVCTNIGHYIAGKL